MERKLALIKVQEIDNKFKKEIEIIQRNISYSNEFLKIILRKIWGQATFDAW